MGKKWIGLILMLLILVPTAAFSQDLEKARIGYMKGDVQISTKDSPDDWFPAAVNTPLQEGDRIWVPSGGRSEVQILGGVVIRLDAATSFDILSLGEESFQFYLNGGRSYINNRRYGIEHIQVDTPLSSISCYDNSLVMIDVSESGATEISVLSGEAYVETRNGKIRVTAGNTLRISEDLAAEFLPLSSPDEWEQWNRDRDRLLADGGQSLRYLPEELDDYVYDFDSNGTWLYASDYGYVWAPRVSLSVGWAPYRIGRWVWVGGDYVWISGEPWGWAPYHYGRWIYLRKAGWCWVPPRRGQVYWAPGYVGWVHTPTEVSWVPLGPGDRYYARRRYSPDTVTSANLTVGLAGASFSFRNMNVKNAVTVQHRDTFLTGRKTAYRVNENPFARKDAVVGPPTFKPQRATLSPAIRTIPKSKLPPERVRMTTVESLKKQRGVVPDQRGSVFAPGQTLREMPATKGEQPKRLQREQKPEYFPETQKKFRQEEEARKKMMKQPAAMGQQFRGRPATPAVPATPAQPAVPSQQFRSQPAKPAIPAQPQRQQQPRSIEMKREATPRTPARVQAPQAPVRVQAPQPTRPVPNTPSQPQAKTPQPAAAPEVRQPSAPVRNRPLTPGAPAQPQARPARTERQMPKPETVKQQATLPQSRGPEMKRERIPQTPARVQTPQEPVRMQAPQPTPAPVVRQPATPPQQFRGRPAAPAAPAAPAQPARIERQQPQQPAKPRIEEQVRTPGNAVKKDNPDQGVPPAANPGRQMREGTGWRQ